VSSYLIDELVELIKFDTKAPYKFVKLLRDVLGRFELIEPENEFAIEVRDPKDQPIITAAVQGRCDLLLTGDEDLLSLLTAESTVLIL